MASIHIHVIGGGLAGSEAAWQAARLGHRVVLHEMRPLTPTPAHRTDRLAELVCSNSLKSDQPATAPWLLKEELRRLGSLLVEVAARARVPGGHALTVDRDLFAGEVTRAIEQEPAIEIRREEVTAIPAGGITIIATGPLTSDALAAAIVERTGSERLYFYDSISPIVEGDTIDHAVVFRGSRYGKSLDGTGDYLNCPFTRERYERFYEALVAAEPVPLHEFERTPFFEACLPIEELARRGRDTLRFGPMKPVGLPDPRSGRIPYAVVQLRQENLRADSYNLVGFQNHLKFGEQKRVLRLIPGLEHAEFSRFGQIHRNTYINAPALLDATLRLQAQQAGLGSLSRLDLPAAAQVGPRGLPEGEPPRLSEMRPRDLPQADSSRLPQVSRRGLPEAGLPGLAQVFFAGQISGVEGYVEAIATGLMAGRHAARLAEGRAPAPLPRETALGSLAHYISAADTRHYQPANITFDLLPALPDADHRRLARDKQARRELQCRRALEALEKYCVECEAVCAP